MSEALRDWNDHYATGHLPWDTGKASGHLTRLVSERGLSGKALDVGCGTGTNSLWLAGHGFSVLGLDIAPLAVEAARAKAEQAREPECRFEVLDFLSEEVPGGPFELVFDRGVFHTFDAAETRARFAARVAELLTPDGLWLSLLGSTEGAPRDTGPPRRSARDVADAIEPALELVELRATTFDSDMAWPAWTCLSRRRAQPAQPSSRRD
ncbi:MAG TPA: class I SAM-dependent methyltransferase [Planctomycetes bacterium]|nr:class I SAM-dependent methyltransferase [Planctomycetota bacterium]